ncbi:PREDICTED: F-box protein CPR30-like [Fragaria vesca subsp. vesca]
MAESDLPEEVMMSILCWLPVKSLIRFTSVSKRWRFIILSDPKFATSQSNAARQRKTLGRRLIFSAEAPRLASQLVSLDLADTASFGHPSSSVRHLTLPFERLGGGPPRDVRAFRLLGSCNGLVFVAFAVSSFYIWNPATGIFKELPKPGFPHSCRELTYYGAGYLSATDDYRVFATSYGVYSDGDSYDVQKMFSSRAHVWKTIQDPCPYKASPNQAILLNEALHWVKHNVLLAFDFAQEQFRTMRVPGTDGLGFKNAGVSEGCLCVCRYLSACSVDFWVMREYGVDDSWTKLFNFSPVAPRRYEDFFVMDSCTVALKWAMGLQQALVKIDHKQEEEIGKYMLPVMLSNWYRVSMIPYQESLLWIYD